MGTAPFADLRFALLNDWQRGFPIVPAPFAAVAAACGAAVPAVIDAYRALLAEGAISRIGGTWGTGVGGALLCAFAVPAERLEAVAAIVSADPGVNHNYEREHRYNLWFVVTGTSEPEVQWTLSGIEYAMQLPVLRLPLLEEYHIDLGLDLRGALSARSRRAVAGAARVDLADEPLAALVEDGLPLLATPYEAWAEALGVSGEHVRATLARWLRQGTLRRFGAIVRHHEAGFAHNAMTVLDVADASVDACGEVLAAQRGVTLAYRRERAAGWPYNLYCMVHGRDRAGVEAAIATAIERSGLARSPRAVLFSRRRFKQTGARYFRGRCVEGALREPA
jgi:DNA-binding Lrp family transcriptional regulator